MKILIVTPYVGATYGGPSKAVAELAAALGQRGLQIDVVTTIADGSGQLAVPVGVWQAQANYRIQYFSCWHRQDLIFSGSLLWWLLRHARDYHLIHTNTLFSPLISLTHWICRLHQIPYMVTPHGMLEPWALSYKAWKKRIYYVVLEKPALQRSRAMQALNHREANSIKALNLRSPTVVIPNGIHQQEFDSLPSPEHFYQQFPATRDRSLILFLSRIDPKKGLDLLAPAFAKVLAQVPQAHLVVAGPDSIGFLPIAQQYFQQAGCLHAVTFTGMLTGTLKQAALAAAHVYVLPSYSEGFSLSVLEGMAAGLPCVITTGCNFPEAEQAQAAWVVDPNSEAIAAALITCLSDPDNARIMGDRARQLVLQHYTWERSAAALAQVYAQVIRQGDSAEIASRL